MTDVKPCKHPKKQITIITETDTEEGYGCPKYITTEKLKCNQCGAESSQLGSYDQVYEEFTGRVAYEDFAPERRNKEIKDAKAAIKAAKAVLRKHGVSFS